MKKIVAAFTHQGENLRFEREIISLDRNYDDERYAYFIEPSSHAENGIYEINIDKDEDGNLIPKGYAAYYEDFNDNDFTILIDAKIQFLDC